MINRKLRIGTRPSLLALKQVEEITKRLPELDFEIIKIKTSGDIDKKSPLNKFENSDFFSREIEQALICKTIDIAIHSAKDLEKNIPEELEIVAVTKSINSYDVLVAHDNLTLKTLPPYGCIGTSSNVRRNGILKYRQDLFIKDIRGNIDERLHQLDIGNFDAIVIAYAALIRLGLENRISQVIPKQIIKPNRLQGMLAVQTRKDREDLKEIFRSCNGR